MIQYFGIYEFPKKIEIEKIMEVPRKVRLMKEKTQVSLTLIKV